MTNHRKTSPSRNRILASRLAAAHEVAEALQVDPNQAGSMRLADALASNSMRAKAGQVRLRRR